MTTKIIRHESEPRIGRPTLDASGSPLPQIVHLRISQADAYSIGEIADAGFGHNFSSAMRALLRLGILTWYANQE